MDEIFNREFIYTSGDGGYLMTTLSLANHRKYHSLFIKPLWGNLSDRYNLLSSLDETVIIGNESYSLYTHQYINETTPTGYKFIIDAAHYPSVTFKLANVTIKKEMLLSQVTKSLIVRYTFKNLKETLRMQIAPILAYRHIHSLADDNKPLNKHIHKVEDGICYSPYIDMPELYIQTDRKHQFVTKVEREYDFYYQKEDERGYAATEPLIKIGYFCTDIFQDGVMTISVALENNDMTYVNECFEKELERLPDAKNTLSRLHFAASQFLITTGGSMDIIAGYPWFNAWGRDTFISLPYITMESGMLSQSEKVIDNLISQMNNAQFINTNQAFNSLDAPLWFFYTLQHLEKYYGERKIYEKYFPVMENILESYLNGIDNFVSTAPDMLLRANNSSLSWMDAIIDGKSASPRNSIMVEINALWYNAISYCLKLANHHHNEQFIDKWRPVANTLSKSFIDCFWIKEESYLADSAEAIITNDTISYQQDKAKRPNQLIATSLPFIILNNIEIEGVISLVEQYLLTPYGIRTLSANDENYIGTYQGDVTKRDKAYHNGCVWVWLLPHYVQGAFTCRGELFAPQAEYIYDNLTEAIDLYGIGTIAEIFEGNTPHLACGAVSQAWSVAAAINIKELIEENTL